jgi:hypothetical protein
VGHETEPLGQSPDEPVPLPAPLPPVGGLGGGTGAVVGWGETGTGAVVAEGAGTAEDEAPGAKTPPDEEADGYGAAVELGGPEGEPPDPPAGGCIALEPDGQEGAWRGSSRPPMSVWYLPG